MEEVPAEEPAMDSEEEMGHEDEGMGDGMEGYEEEEEMAPAMDSETEEDEMHDEDEMRGSDEMRGTSEEMGDEDEMRGSDEMDAPEEAPADEMELEAIIRELEDEMAGEEDEEMPAEEPVAEQSDTSKIGNGDNTVDVADGTDETYAETENQSAALGSEDENTEKVDDLKEGEGEDEDEPVDLEEIIKSLSEEDGDDGTPEEGPAQEDEKVQENSKKLKEAYATIRFMKSKLTEVNLLNAKLLFANKLFRGNNLDEGQKIRVIETFDRAGTVREVKLVYSTLAESLRYDAKTTKRVNKITEGLASKPSKTTKPASKAVISESTVQANRFKKLAGLIK
jgi:hypothetical protein